LGCSNIIGRQCGTSGCHLSKATIDQFSNNILIRLGETILKRRRVLVDNRHGLLFKDLSQFFARRDCKGNLVLDVEEQCRPKDKHSVCGCLFQLSCWFSP